MTIIMLMNMCVTGGLVCVQDSVSEKPVAWKPANINDRCKFNES